MSEQIEICTWDVLMKSRSDAPAMPQEEARIVLPCSALPGDTELGFELSRALELCPLMLTGTDVIGDTIRSRSP